MIRESFIEKKVILKSELEARNDYKKLDELFIFFSIFSLSSFYFFPLALFFLSFYISYLIIFYLEYFSKKTFYKLLLSPKISKKKYVNIGYAIFEEEINSHLNIVQNAKELAKKEKQNKNVFYRQVGFDKTHMTKHFWVLGSTGAGKTAFLLNLFDKTIKKGGGFIFIDGKAETIIFKKLYTIAKQYNREHELFVLNFLTETSSEDTHTFNPLSGSATQIREFLFNLLPEGKGDQEYWVERGKLMFRPLISYYCLFRDYFNASFTYKELFESRSLDKYIAIAVHILVLAFILDKKAQKEILTNVKQAKAFLKNVEFKHLFALTDYLLSYPLSAKKVKNARFYIEVSFLLREILSYLNEVLPELSLKIKDFINDEKETIFTLPLKNPLEFQEKVLSLSSFRDLLEEVNENQNYIIQHNYAVQQWAKPLSAFEIFKHIFASKNPEVDITKIIKNNFMLYVALPPLKQSAKTSETLGKMIISAIRSAMSFALDEKLSLSKAQALIRNSAVKPNPLFLLVFDEFGSYSSNIINDIIAQARSLRFSVFVATQDYTSAKGIDGKDEHTARRLWANTQKIVLKIEDDETISLLEKSIKEIEFITSSSYDLYKETVEENATFKKDKIIDLKILKNFANGFGVIFSDYFKPVFFQSYYIDKGISDTNLIHFE